MILPGLLKSILNLSLCLSPNLPSTQQFYDLQSLNTGLSLADLKAIESMKIKLNWPDICLPIYITVPFHFR